MSGRLFIQFVPDPQNYYGTDNGCTDVTEPAGLPRDTEQAQQPVADDTTYESEEQINPAAFSFAAGKFSGNKACQDSSDNCFNHNYFNFKTIFYQLL